jgi:hypothetical protein
MPTRSRSSDDSNELVEVAARITTQSLPATATHRLVLVACIVGLGIASAPDQWGRVLLQTTVLILGVVAAWIHSRPRLTRAIGRRFPRFVDVVWGKGATEVHNDIPGDLEGAGTLLCVAMFLGPWPISTDTAILTTLGIVATSAVGVSIFWNFNLVPGWFGRLRLRGRVVFAVLPLLPLVVLAGWIVGGVAWAGVEVEVSGCIVAVLLHLTTYAFRWLYALGARAGVAAIRSDRRVHGIDASRQAHAISPVIKTLHKLVEAGELGMARYWARDLRWSFDEVLSDLRNGLGRRERTTIGELLDKLKDRIPDLKGLTLVADPQTRSLEIESVGHDEVRIFTGDLLANAVAARAQTIRVTIRVRHPAGSAQDLITLTVQDDGPGFDPAIVLADPNSSLGTLNAMLGTREGTLRIESQPGRTVATAQWRTLGWTRTK